MFTDQVESTANMARRTPAEIKRISRDQDELTAEGVRQCRGTILNDTGDGHIIEFRSCSDAVLCGRILQGYVQARNEAQTNDLLKFGLHIGIDFGEALVLPDGRLRANAANLAARVCSECPSGEVYFTEKVKKELHDREARVERVGPFKLKGIGGKIALYRLDAWLSPIEPVPNPFIWRGGITKAEDFFNRDNEQRTLRAYLHGRQNCQIVGERRIGKTSLLRQIERIASEWERETVVAYLDLQDPHCFTLSGWLGRVSREYGWPAPVPNLVAFDEAVEAMISSGSRPVLCLDEFEELTLRGAEFTRDFFLTLRSCGQRGMSIVAASRRPLSELTEPGDPTSPFYNTFPLLRLGTFTDNAALAFVTIHHIGVPPFTPGERKAILEFAKGHPLALQVACFQVVEARQNRGSLITSMQGAADDMRAGLPSGW